MSDAEEETPMAPMSAEEIQKMYFVGLDFLSLRKYDEAVEFDKAAKDRDDTKNESTDGVIEENASEQKEPMEVNGKDSGKETEESKAANGSSGTSSEEKKDKNDEASKTEKVDDENADGASGSDQDSDGTDSEDIDNEDENIENLEIAWEVLEVARNILLKQEPNHDKLLLADIVEKLGEISRENGNYDAAVEDFKKSMDIRKSVEKCGLRLIATSYYQIGLTYLLSTKNSEAKKNFLLSKESLEECLMELKSETEPNEDSIKGINEVIAEINEKITESSNEPLKALQVASEQFAKRSLSGEVSTIVPRKRPSQFVSDLNPIEEKIKRAKE